MLEVIEHNDTHYYEFEGRRVAGVSEVLALTGLVNYDHVSPAVLERAAERGSDVHLACMDLDLGKPDWWSDDETIGPFVDGYALFKRDFGFRADAIEQPMFHPDLRYAGTPDRFGSIQAVTKRFNATVDLKRTCKIEDHVAIQLAAYNLFADDYQERKRIVVRLKPHGYDPKEFTDNREDTAVWMSALNIAKWKNKHFGLGVWS